MRLTRRGRIACAVLAALLFILGLLIADYFGNALRCNDLPKDSHSYEYYCR